MSKIFEDLPKIIFIFCLIAIVFGGTYLLGAVSYRNNLPPMKQLITAYRMLFVENSPVARAPRGAHMQPSRGQGDGVTVNEAPDQGSLISLVGFFEEQTQLRLIRRDGTLVHKWSLDYLEHFPDPEARHCRMSNPLSTDVHGAHVTPQGDVIFNYEYCGTVKLDQCGEVLWTINKPTHHSVVPAEAGGYWILGRKIWPVAAEPDRFPPFSTFVTERHIQEDTLMRVAEDGEILEEVSIPEKMVESGLQALLTANGENFVLRKPAPRIELVHSNKAAELSSEIADAFPLFKAGDIAISMRELNLVIVMDRDTKEVKWYQTGPWLRQHDPEFRPDGRISIFNNNTYHTSYEFDQTILSRPFTTNIMVIDPVTRKTEVVYGEKPGQELFSVIRGQHELLENDGILIIEFDAGRILEVNAEREIVWEYVNRYNDDYVGEIVNAAVHPAEYFQADFNSCAER